MALHPASSIPQMPIYGRVNASAALQHCCCTAADPARQNRRPDSGHGHRTLTGKNTVALLSHAWPEAAGIGMPVGQGVLAQDTIDSSWTAFGQPGICINRVLVCLKNNMQTQPLWHQSLWQKNTKTILEQVFMPVVKVHNPCLQRNVLYLRAIFFYNQTLLYYFVEETYPRYVS